MSRLCLHLEDRKCSQQCAMHLHENEQNAKMTNSSNHNFLTAQVDSLGTSRDHPNRPNTVFDSTLHFHLVVSASDRFVYISKGVSLNLLQLLVHNGPVNDGLLACCNHFYTRDQSAQWEHDQNSKCQCWSCTCCAAFSKMLSQLCFCVTQIMSFNKHIKVGTMMCSTSESITLHTEVGDHLSSLPK